MISDIINQTLVILPECGDATRIGNIPKFLLPVSNNTSLLKNILEILINNNIKNIWISTQPQYGQILYNYTKEFEYVNIKLNITKTMSETIKDYEKIKQPYTLMYIPDTYITDKDIANKMLQELSNNNIDVIVAVWKIKKYQYGKLGQVLLDENDFVLKVSDKDKTCTYEYAWGAIGWKNDYWKYIISDTNHIVYGLNHAIENGLKIKAIIMEGEYYDCGTINEYLLACKKYIN